MTHLCTAKMDLLLSKISKANAFYLKILFKKYHMTHICVPQKCIYSSQTIPISQITERTRRDTIREFLILKTSPTSTVTPLLPHIKYLGIQLDEELRYTPHIDYLYSKIIKMLQAIRPLIVNKRGYTQKACALVYNDTVGAIWKYRSTIYSHTLIIKANAAYLKILFEKYHMTHLCTAKMDLLLSKSSLSRFLANRATCKIEIFCHPFDAKNIMQRDILSKIPAKHTSAKAVWEYHIHIM